MIRASKKLLPHFRESDLLCLLRVKQLTHVGNDEAMAQEAGGQPTPAT
jgi:hypothetical protein